MNYQSVYVIRDGEGNYISPRQTKRVVLCSLYWNCNRIHVLC